MPAKSSRRDEDKLVTFQDKTTWGKSPKSQSHLFSGRLSNPKYENVSCRDVDSSCRAMESEFESLIKSQPPKSDIGCIRHFRGKKALLLWSFLDACDLFRTCSSKAMSVYREKNLAKKSLKQNQIQFFPTFSDFQIFNKLQNFRLTALVSYQKKCSRISHTDSRIP